MSSPNIWLLFGSFESITFEVKRLRLLFGQLLDKFGLLDIPTFGHTDSKLEWLDHLL